MLDLERPARSIYDTGDILRRDGVCEQRGRFTRDDGRFDQPGEVFGACAGAALYRRAPALELGGFDERFFLYLEDVDLALRLRLAGWTCVYEPAVALHAGEGSGGTARAPGGRMGGAQHAADGGAGLPVDAGCRWCCGARRAGRGTRCGRGGSAPTCAARCPRCRCCPPCGASGGRCGGGRCRSRRRVPPHPLRGQRQH